MLLSCVDMHAPRMSFHFEKCLGQGGFGEVYLATLQRPGGLNKRVAVKVLKEELRNAHEAVQRLRDEGRMLAILQHPCIVRVLEMTLINGRVSLVTEYIDGIDLARCCKEPRLLPHSVIVGVLGEVASGLHCAWTTPSPETGKPLKLIHRDVKPENIRVGKHGEVKLLDFGIARTTEMFRHAKTAQGDLPFTPGYAAPEAFTKGFQGSSSDVYALGVTLYRLVAGERFYEGMDLSAQVSTCCLNERYAPFVRKRLLGINAPPAIVELIRDMLAYEAVERPTAHDVEQRCAAILQTLDGPTHVRWARATEFPEPKGLAGGSLTGLTIEEDAIQGPRRPVVPRGVRLTPKADGALDLLRYPTDPQPQPQPQPPSMVTDLTPPAGAPALHPPSPVAENRNPTPTVPPPLPRSLMGNTVRPNTGPVSLQEYLPVPEDPTTMRMPSNIKSTLDGFLFAEMETERVRIAPEESSTLDGELFAEPGDGEERATFGFDDADDPEPIVGPALPVPIYEEATGSAIQGLPSNTVSVVPALGRIDIPRSVTRPPVVPEPPAPGGSPMVLAMAVALALGVVAGAGVVLAVVGVALGIWLASL